jgi:histone acetyltransferase (RNA polymerase elongator complex component)
VEKDIQTFREVFSDVYLKPDELKVYPTSVIPNTELYRLYQEGAYQPITTEEILRIIRVIFQEIIPPYTRIKRLIRDIPAPEIAAGSSITNLSQLAHTALLDEYQHNVDAPVVQRFYHRLWASDELITTEVYEGDTPYGHKIPPTPSRSSDGTGFYERGKYRHFVSLDTRSREVRNKKEQTKQLNLVMRKYQSSVGSEFFISYEDELGYLYGFIRLLLPDAAQAIDFP